MAMINRANAARETYRCPNSRRRMDARERPAEQATLFGTADEETDS